MGREFSEELVNFIASTEVVAKKFSLKACEFLLQEDPKCTCRFLG
jgi:hypothetical protein